VSCDESVLDDPVGHSLPGRHAHLSRRAGRIATYLPGVATFAAVPADAATADWAALADLLGPGELADLFSSSATPPGDWEQAFELPGVQMLAPVGAVNQGDERVVRLGAGNVEEMLALARLTRPGPFWPRTVELGTYLGIRDGADLVAMAGERLGPPGWTEISAVCTAPAARGRGYAATLVRALQAGIAARGERAFLHVAAENTGAVALYERLGFTLRRDVVFRGYLTPSPETGRSGARPHA